VRKAIRRLVVLISAAAIGVVAVPALAKKSRHHAQPAIPWYRVGGDVEVRCVDRSFSVSVGNPAYPNRALYWPAPCRP